MCAFLRVPFVSWFKGNSKGKFGTIQFCARIGETLKWVVPFSLPSETATSRGREGLKICVCVCVCLRALFV